MSHTGAAVAHLTVLRTMVQGFIKACGHRVYQKSVATCFQALWIWIGLGLGTFLHQRFLK